MLLIKRSPLKLMPLGHGHPTGETGELFIGLNGFTTALELLSKIEIKIKD